MTRSHAWQTISAQEATKIATGSRFAMRVQRRYSDWLGLLPASTPKGALNSAPVPSPSSADLQACYSALLIQNLDAGAALRVLRQLVLARLVELDTQSNAPLAAITECMTRLAEFALGIACNSALAALDAVHGIPQATEAAAVQRSALWIVGMGKLGARELNVSSDIDLIFIASQDGQTTGVETGGVRRGQISQHEYFAKAVRMVSTMLSDVTEHGFVFRIDLALRPHGHSGPAVVSLEALEEYFQLQGREWERFAWLKSRVVAGDIASASALRSVVLPFVFRKYLDYNVFEALRTLHSQIRSHASKRAAGRPERANDVKLSRGGIRELEFTVQLLQVVRAGQFPELRTRSTLEALKRFAAAGIMPAETANALSQAYVFLRQVEHRIQYLDDLQTHILPTDDTDLDWIALSMGYPNCCPFLSMLNTHRERVALEFDTLLRGAPVADKAGNCKACGLVAPESQSAQSDLSPVLTQRLDSLREHPRVLALREDARGRVQRLVQRSIGWLREGQIQPQTLLRFIDWLETLLRRESYVAMLLERPAVHARVLRILGAASWSSHYLLLHPGVIDELAQEDWLRSRFDAAQLEHEVNARLKALKSSAQDDEEAVLNVLRRAHHSALFRTLVRDSEQHISIEQVADDLSALADTLLSITVRHCWARYKARHQDTPQLAIIGYGKLGGKELGYGSDLDIVFVYDDMHEDASAIYAGFVRKLITWLTVKTSEGDLFDIDTALRPNGNSGLLVTSMQAYEDYQGQRGSNTAWTWEHQAMTRARCVLGSDTLRKRFEAVRQAVLCAPRQSDALKQEIMAMRERVRAAHRLGVGTFDVKHSPGGMVDAEFAVQSLVLAHAHAAPALRANAGNIALLQAAEEAKILSAGVGQAAADAYRTLRRMQHSARLHETPTQVPDNLLQVERAAIGALYSAIFK
jgi:[glutamine synthetase] adenylyltransferase / [glutamine synthetase]-adenylyl-L-tyrosine phosphorylase